MCDAYAGINRAGLGADKLQNAVRAEADRAASQSTKKPAQTRGPPEAYSVDAAYAEKLKEWAGDGMPSDASFTLGTTGDVLQGLGAIESDIYMDGGKIRTILAEHPEMTLREIERIPEILDDPVMILKSRNVGRGNQQNSRLVIFGSLKAQNGKPVLSVLDLRPNENGFILTDMQKVTSAYTKDTNPAQFVQSSEILFADKKRTAPLLRSLGFHMPSELQRSGSIGSISYKGQNVNLRGEKFSDIVKLDDSEKTTAKLSPETAADRRKAAQFAVIQSSNAAEDDYHTWIRCAYKRDSLSRGVSFVRLCSPRQLEQGAEMGRDLALLFGRLILEPADDVKQAASAGLIRVFAEHQLIQ